MPHDKYLLQSLSMVYIPLIEQPGAKIWPFTIKKLMKCIFDCMFGSQATFTAIFALRSHNFCLCLPEALFYTVKLTLKLLGNACLHNIRSLT